MKKIAFLLLFFFGIAWSIPVILSFSAESKDYVINLDEEKSVETKDAPDNIEKKEYYDMLLHFKPFNPEIKTAFHLSYHIPLPPCLEKLTPPPNQA